MSFREERAAERKMNIIKVAAKLFSEKGYHDATLEDIAKNLKYTKGSIYYYINSKQELLFQCHELAMDMLINRMEEIVAADWPLEVKLKEGIKAHIEMVVGEMSLVTVALGQEFELQEDYRQIIVARRDQYERYFRRLVDEGVEKGIFRPVPSKMAVFIIMGAVNWIPRWYSEKGSMSKEEIAEFFADYLVRPLLQTQA
ncbi:MAG: TetR/AcrR family transcriptional regulator [Armatimonadetes bacterium]|nr:TetR/AcrR family transcriptional regulator [Armatimonadota bacterium]